ncbi:MAG: rod shape-determining protein MreD, partial [Prevotella sp.]|nr:rod shape-determining protein MreD [Prevotella sp.]
LAQSLVLGGIHLFNCATPLLYVYFVMMFPRNYPKWALLLWSFSMGLLIDVLFNTPGLAAASLTLIAAIQPYLLEAFTTQDSAENLEPTLKTLGWKKYTVYAVMTVLIFCIVIYSLEMFSFFNLLHWAMCVIGSTLITLVFIFTFEITRSKK